MSEKATLTPSTKKYEGLKYNLTSTDLEALRTRIKSLDKADVAKGLEAYKGVVPGKDGSKNTFEMMALYQAALKHMGYAVECDGRFGQETHKALKESQSDKLKSYNLTPDGLPGPKTTEALIKELQKASAQKVPPVASTSAPAASAQKVPPVASTSAPAASAQKVPPVASTSAPAASAQKVPPVASTSAPAASAQKVPPVASTSAPRPAPLFQKGGTTGND